MDKPVCFVGYRWGLAGSNHMRGLQMAKELTKQGVKAYCIPRNICDIGDGIYVFIKHIGGKEVKFVKERRGKIVLDLIDIYCHRENEKQMTVDKLNEIDALILPNKKMAKVINFNKPMRVIHHHWDSRHTVNFDLYRKNFSYAFRLGYVGFRESAIFTDKIPEMTVLGAFVSMFTFSSLFTCHYNVRTKRDQIYKPCTKIPVAAAVESNTITTKDYSVQELLPEDYPYYIECNPEPKLKDVMNTISYARESFGSSTWKYGLKAMAEVKERTKIENIAKEYKSFFEEIC